MTFKATELIARIVSRVDLQPPRTETKPKVETASNTHAGSEGRSGEVRAEGSQAAFMLGRKLEAAAENIVGDVVSLLTTAARHQPNPSTAAGEEAAREVSEALDDIDNRNLGDIFFGEDDADKKIDDAVAIVEAHADDPEFQRAFLETLGADDAARLEDRLRDKGGRDGIVRDSLSVAGNTLSTQFQKDLVGKLSLDDIIRYTSDESSPMPDAFLVAAGKKAMDEGIEYYTPQQPFAITVQLADPRIDTILQNIAASSPAAANKLLRDEAFVGNMLLANDILEDHNSGVPALIRAGTDPALVPSTNDRSLALRSLSQVLSRPDSFQTINVTSSSDDKIVDSGVAEALAEAYKNNVQSFANASQQPTTNRNSFDNEDVRAFMTAALEHESTRERMSATTQVMAGIMLQRGSDFRNTDPNALNIAADQVGTFLGTYTDAYADGVNLNLQVSERDRIFNSLLSSAILAVPSLAVSPGTALAANFVANLVTSLESGGDNADAVKAALDRGERATVGGVENAVFQQYYDRARYALAHPNAAGITTQDLADAGAFVEQVRRYNDSLPPSQRILDAQGNLVAVQNLDPDNNPAHARIIENIGKLINGTARGGEQVVYNQINGAIDKIKTNFNQQVG